MNPWNFLSTCPHGHLVVVRPARPAIHDHSPSIHLFVPIDNLHHGLRLEPLCVHRRHHRPWVDSACGTRVPIASACDPDIVDLSRARSSTTAFLYPTYATYKALCRRPADEQELERWLMYWSVRPFVSRTVLTPRYRSVIGVVVGVEYVAEWLVSWYAPRAHASAVLYTHA